MGEEALVGGMDPDRGVIRVGDTVRRPGMRAAVRALLVHLENVGFEAAPRYLGVDDEGRDVVSWVEGDVPIPPYPAWALEDEALTALGRLARDYHAAVATFDASGLEGWSDQWGDPRGGPLVCHNDLFPENVVFRNGLPVALIDFDEASPGRPLWDLAIAAEEWAPLHAQGARLAAPDTLDAVHRLGLLAAAYGLEPDRADEFLDLVMELKEQTSKNIHAQARAGDQVWIQHLAETGYDERAEADVKWLTDLRPAFAAAIAHQGR